MEALLGLWLADTNQRRPRAHMNDGRVGAGIMRLSSSVSMIDSELVLTRLAHVGPYAGVGWRIGLLVAGFPLREMAAMRMHQNRRTKESRCEPS